MARKVDSPKSGYSIGQGLFTTSDLYATPQHVVLSHAAGVASEGILSLLGVGSMQDRANELPRIPLLSTWVNKGIEKAGAAITPRPWSIAVYSALGLYEPSLTSVISSAPRPVAST